jgi:hypothetical protein
MRVTPRKMTSHHPDMLGRHDSGDAAEVDAADF